MRAMRLATGLAILAVAAAFQAPRGRTAQRAKSGVARSHPVDLLEAATSVVTAYSDDQNAFLEGFSPAVAGTVAGTTVLVGGLFATLAKSLKGGSNLAVTLSEEEEAAVGTVSTIYDGAADDAALTESGTKGEVKRKQEATQAKRDYQSGKNDRDVRDKTLGYAEVDLAWLATLLRQVDPQPGEKFLDLGSGMGKAVLGTAALYPGLKKVAGIEILPGLHSKAQGFSRKLRRGAKTEFLNEDFCDVENKKVAAAIGEADIIFAFATRFAAQSDVLTEMSAAVGQLAKPGTRIICLDRRLRGPFQLVKEVDDLRGDLQLTRGYIYTVVE